MKIAGWALLGIILLAGAGAPASTAPARRDWLTNPAVLVLETQEDVYAVGDLHGDYEKALKLLAAAGLVKAQAQPTWTGGKSVLVCTGDFIDKGPQSLETVELLRRLQTDAAKAGGRVVVTLGNHEAEFLAAGGASEKSADFANELKSRGTAATDVAQGHDADGLGTWLRNLPVAAKVNDTFFCHAGNTGGMNVKELEQAVEAGVDKEGFGAFVLAEPNSLLEARLAPVPWFVRAATTRPAGTGDTGTATLRAYLAALGCRRLVMGHQPGAVSFGGGVDRKAGEPFCYEGILYLIDVGVSRGVQDSAGAVLKIHQGTKAEVKVRDIEGRERGL